MTCLVCDTWTPADPATGYDAGGICPSCQAAGYDEGAHGEILGPDGWPLDWLACDVCRAKRPCVRNVTSGSIGETSACHACRREDQCDECEETNTCESSRHTKASK